MACNSNSHGRDRRLLLPGMTSIAAMMLLLLMPIKAADSGYGYEPDSLERPGGPPQYHKQRVLSTIIGVQGIIYCRSGTKLTPLGGTLISCICICMLVCIMSTGMTRSDGKLYPDLKSTLV